MFKRERVKKETVLDKLEIENHPTSEAMVYQLNLSTSNN